MSHACVYVSARPSLHPNYLLAQFACISARLEALSSKQSRQGPFSVLWRTLSSLMIRNQDNYRIKIRRMFSPGSGTRR